MGRWVGGWVGGTDLGGPEVEIGVKLVNHTLIAHDRKETDGEGEEADEA